jgi:hypothetical protein
MSWRSDFPELADAEFGTAAEAMAAEEEVIKRRQSASAMQGIGKMGTALSKMREAEATPDAWAKPGISVKELQRIGEGQGLSDVYKGNKMGLAADYGITASPAPEAKGFVGGLKAEHGEQESVYEQRTADLAKIRAMSEGPEKDQALEDYYSAVAGGQVFSTTDPAILAERRKAYERAKGKTLGDASVADLRAAIEAKIKYSETMGGKAAELESEKEKEKYLYKKTSAEKQEVVDIISEIRNSEALATGLDPARLIQAVPGTEGYVFAQQVKNLKNRLSLEGRQKLKGQGQISDFEGKMLANSVSILDLNLPQDAFLAELQRIDDVLAGKYRMKEEAVEETPTTQKPANLTDAEWEEMQRLEAKYGK